MCAETSENDRLRPHPETRFAPHQVLVDLPEIISRIRSEPKAGEGGRRQETVYKSKGLTIALFAFERFTNLPEHRAEGIVNMHVLRGQLKITAEDQTHELHAGQMLVLSPGMKHAVSAQEESELLVTVRLTDA